MRFRPSPWHASQRPPLHVETETSRFVAALPRFRQHGVEIANGRERLRVGGRIGARRAPDRRLIDFNDFVDESRPSMEPCAAGSASDPYTALAAAPVQNIVHQRRFAAARNAGHQDQQAQRKFDVDIFQIVRRRAANHDAARYRRAPLRGIAIWRAPERYCPVSEVGIALRSRAACPAPPVLRPAGPRPAPGRSRNRRARWSRHRAPPPARYCPDRADAPGNSASGHYRARCRPMEGSSRTYSTPRSLEPICVARRMRCASPPESVAAERSRLR